MTKNVENLTVKLPKKWVDHLNDLAKNTKKTKDFYVKESLVRYLEDVEDLQIGLERLKSKSKVYSSEEANERLKELMAAKPIRKSV